MASRPELHRSAYDRHHTTTSRDLGPFDCIEAPCTDVCDLEQRVPEYMRRVRDGDLAGAAAVTRADNPLASILGRTCHHPCEPVCLRTHMDRPLAIREIKRFITDREPPPDEPAPGGTGSPVAIIGGGPCGLSAATFLARSGRAVTIFEARSTTGGMVSATIPDYRAARAAIDRDLERCEALGVKVRGDLEIGRTLTLSALRQQGFETIVVAIGAGRGLRLGVEGENADGVHDGLDFLRAARSGLAPAVGPRVGVIGGGDVAMDCARTALRMGGPDVAVFYRRTRSEMPAQPEELEDLLAEGGRVIELVAPASIDVEDGELRGLRLSRMRLGAPDASGRRRPEPLSGAELAVELDTLIVAIGQRPDLGLFDGEPPRLNGKGYLDVDPETLETSFAGVYAGGDIIGEGPANIVKAAGDGRRIAEAIVSGRDTTGSNGPLASWPAFDRVDLARRRARTSPRTVVPQLDPSERQGFDEVVQTLAPEAARREAARCLDCDLLCSTCESVCPNRAIVTYHASPTTVAASSSAEGDSARPFHIKQGPQVAVLADACNECGNCATFCPTLGQPWRDKPRLFLDRDGFLQTEDNAFMLLSVDGRTAIQGRFDGHLEELVEVTDGLRYSTPEGVWLLDSRTIAVFDGPAHELDSARLGPLLILLRSFAESMPEFPRVEADPRWLLGTDDVRG